MEESLIRYFVQDLIFPKKITGRGGRGRGRGGPANGESSA